MARRRKKPSSADVFFGLIGLCIFLLISKIQANSIWDAAGSLVLLVVGLAVIGLALVTVAKYFGTKQRSGSDEGVAIWRAPPDRGVGAAIRPVQMETGWSLSSLHQLEWKRFEMLCLGYLRADGAVADTTRIGADGGVDIRVYTDTSKSGIAKLVQCKSWNAQVVGVKPIRELKGVMAAESVGAGIFMSSGDYSREAIHFAAENGIELVSGRDLVDRLRKLPETDREALRAEVFSGDYRTPTCPSCDRKMVLRTSSKGISSGSQFWGCANFPRCRRTLKYSQS